MTNRINSFLCLILLVGILTTFLACAANERGTQTNLLRDSRPLALLNQLTPGPLKTRLDACRANPIKASRFSIGHRGAPLRYPEHTQESYLAAARMGAGVLECDVTFTADRELVCRHSQCDLATTTNILETDLAKKCSEGFSPAVFDTATGQRVRAASARCCTSDLSLSEFRQLEGRRDHHQENATSVEQWLTLPREEQADAYPKRGKLMTHEESIELFKRLGVAMTPELKDPLVEMPFGGDFTRADYAQAMLDAYTEADVPADRVTFQAFSKKNVLYWLSVAPAYGERTAWGMPGDPGIPPPTQAEFNAIRQSGIRRIAPPVSRLLKLDDSGNIVATDYARHARKAGLEIFAWTLERSGVIQNGRSNGGEYDFYLNPILPALRNEGDLYKILHALHTQVGVRAVFSDWPATTTYYANCVGLE